jgi:hypothetical protein
VTRLARPLPVEYLLVDVPASTPLTPQFTFFTDDNVTPFPVENRYHNQTSIRDIHVNGCKHVDDCSITHHLTSLF